mgnify:CR=1 FL=1
MTITEKLENAVAYFRHELRAGSDPLEGSGGAHGEEWDDLPGLTDIWHLKREVFETATFERGIVNGKSSVHLSDGILLYLLARWLEPEAVVEIGTHIGTSSSYIAAALETTALLKLKNLDKVDESTLFTCDGSGDKRCIPERLAHRVVFHGGHSSQIWPEVIGNVGMMFIDGELSPQDLVEISKRNIRCFVVHDTFPERPGDKGHKNVEKLRILFPNAEIVGSLPRKEMPWKIDGLPVNYCSTIVWRG